MAEQQFKREKQSILLKRAAEYTYKETDTEAVREKKEKIHNKILLYGEPLYFTDLEAIVIGDGILDKHESETETDWTVSGSTVEELINAHNYFTSVNAPTFYSNDIKKPTLDSTPVFDDDSLNIATTAFVEAAVKARVAVFYGTTPPVVADNHKYPILWVDTSEGSQGPHVIKIKYTAISDWVSLYDNVILTNQPQVDETPAINSNSKLIATTEYVDRAIFNGAEVYYGTEEPSASMTFAGDNQKYPLIYIYKSTNEKDETVETPYVFDKKGSLWNVFENLSLTGKPTAPTNSTVTDSSTQIATDEFVWNAIKTLDVSELDLDASETIDKISETDGKISVSKQSISITYDQVKDGTVKRPLPGTNTAYPLMDGTRSCGTSSNYSCEDHRHPTDTTREAVGNKITSWSGTASDTKYPSEKLVKNYIDTNAVTKTKRTSGTIYVVGVEVSNPSGTTSTTNKLQYNASGSNCSDGVRIDCGLGVLKGAAWNDFAEYRKCIYSKPGTVVCETGDGELVISGEKLQAGAYIISDTYGMVVGPEREDFQPVAVAGRVLAYYTGEPTDYKPGAAVCAGPFGRILPMDREDIKNYPDRILGYVSEIPTYEEWNGIPVNNRIWIKVN